MGTDVTDSSARKEARWARRQEESRAKTVAPPEELCRQNERFHSDNNVWQTQLDKVASRLVYSRPESAPHHPGN